MNFESEIVNGAFYQMLYFTDYVRKFNFPAKLGDLGLKDRFHVSLLKIPLENLTDEVRQKLEKVGQANNEILIKNPPKLSGKFLCVVDNNRERKIVVALVDFPSIEQWRAKIREILPNVKFAIPHTTLYTNGCAGIFLNDEEDLARMARELDPETKKTLRATWEAKS